MNEQVRRGAQRLGEVVRSHEARVEMGIVPDGWAEGIADLKALLTYVNELTEGRTYAGPLPRNTNPGYDGYGGNAEGTLEITVHDDGLAEARYYPDPDCAIDEQVPSTTLIVKRT